MSVPETPELEKLRAACTQGEWFSAIKPNGKGPGVVGIKVEQGPGAIAVVNGIPGGPERVANTRLIGLAPQLADEVLGLREALLESERRRLAMHGHDAVELFDEVKRLQARVIELDLSLEAAEHDAIHGLDG